MIHSVYGIPGLTVMEASKYLQDARVTHGIVLAGKLVKWQGERQLANPPIVFNSMRAFNANKAKFKSSSIVALIVDSPYVLHDNYSVPLLGAVPKGHTFVFGRLTAGSLLAAVTEKTDTDFVLTPKDYVPGVLKKFRGSSLGGLQTQLYRIKDKDTRLAVNRAMKSFFLSGASLKAVIARIDKVTSNPTVPATFYKLLGTPECNNLKQAVQKTKAHPAKVKKWADTYKVSPFDIKYLLNAAD